MVKIKLKRNRKKLFPHTIVVKISEESYDEVMKLAAQFEDSKSNCLRELIRIGTNHFKKS